MGVALELAASVGPLPGPNPRVGALLLAADGSVIGRGRHEGAGTAHAEVMALHEAGAAAVGSTAVVTLEPCNHTGRTGPCSEALIDAGVARVVIAQRDPNPVAAGGLERLAAAGIDVVWGVREAESRELNEAWSVAVERGRPVVTWKVAGTLDGRVAAANGTSRWITSADARADVHALRATVDAVLVGTGTVLVDDPALTVRDVEHHLEPLRVVMGEREIPSGARILDDSAETLIVRTRDPRVVLDELAKRSIRHVLLEGGPTVAAAFLREGLVDRIVWYVAPALLGAGPSAVADLGIADIGAALRWSITGVSQVGADVRLDLRPTDPLGG